MSWQYHPLLVLFALGGFLSLGVAGYCWQYARSNRWSLLVVSIGLLAFNNAVWVFAALLKTASGTVAGSLLFYKLEFVGAALNPALGVIIALAYIGRERWLTRSTIGLLLGGSTLVLLLFVVNPNNAVILDPRLVSAQGIMAFEHSFTPVTAIALGWTFALALGTMSILGYGVLVEQTPPVPAGIMIGTFGIPLLFGVLKTGGIYPPGGSGINLTPAASAVAIVGVALAVSQYRLFDPIPVGREQAIAELDSGYLLYDSDGTVLDSNASARELLTDDAGTLRDRQIGELLPVIDDAEPAGTTTFSRGEKTLRAETATITRQQQPVAYIVLLQDVTDSEARKRELERTNQRLESLIDAAPLTVMELDTTGEVLRWNDGAEAMFGWTAEEVIGEFNPMVPDDRTAAFDLNRQQVLNGDRIQGKEITRTTKDGSELDLLLSAAPITDPDGEVRSIIAVLDDITAQKRIENGLRALQATAQQLSELETQPEICAETVAAAVDVLGFEMTGMWVANHGEQLVPAQLTEQASDRFEEPPIVARTATPVQRAFAYEDVRVWDPTDTTQPIYQDVSDLAAVITVPIGEYGLLAIATTEETAISDRDIELLRILGATARAALTRADREADLRRQNERLDEFASVVAHDLRNPLSIADGFLDLAVQSGDPEHFAKVEAAHERALKLIDELLTLARGDSTVDDPEQLALDTVARTAWEYVDSDAATVTIADDLPVVAGDENRLTQLFENLYRNAVEHGGEDVAITVAGLPDSRGFYVADDGVGIPPDRRDAVLEHGVSTNDGGTGFGLSIVTDIARAHGWEMSVTESDAGGARFDFTDATVESYADFGN
jgi:PAS domain S-box-containing protein